MKAKYREITRRGEHIFVPDGARVMSSSLSHDSLFCSMRESGRERWRFCRCLTLTLTHFFREKRAMEKKKEDWMRKSGKVRENEREGKRERE